MVADQLGGAWGDVRIGVDLPVRVAQRDADRLAAVLEGEHLLDARKRGSAAVRSAQASITVRARQR